MIKVPEYIDQLVPYKPGKSSDPADFKRYKAVLSSNENNYGPSPLAICAIKELVGTLHLYPDPQGENLVDLLAEKHEVSQENIVLSNGLDGLLYSIFKAFTRPGDHVITNDNSFVAFNKFAAMYDVEVEKALNNDYKFSLDSMVEAITARTRIVYICNPNNPTGGMVGADELAGVIRRVPSDILVIVDEAYFDYARAMDPLFPDSTRMGFQNVLSLRTFSKLYGLAGVRIGYGISNARIIEALKKVKLVFNPNTLAQAGARAALNDLSHINKTLENNTKWISKVESLLAEKGIRYLKSYANFVCAIFKTSVEAEEFNSYMDREDVLLRKLDGFGMPEGVRVSIGTDEEMTYFCEVLMRF